MPREHARILCRIWHDEDFKAHTMVQEWMYFTLLSQSNVTNCGVLPMTVKRWAKLASDAAPEVIRDALSVLEESLFVAVDEDTEEVLVRSFIRNDGVMKLPNVFKNALKQARQIESKRLRNVLATELRRLDRPDATVVADEIEDLQVTLVPEPIGEPVGEPMADGFQKTCGEGEGEGVSSSPLLPSKSGSVLSHKPARRGTRVPEDFAPTIEMIAWARTNTPLVGQAATEDFMDYWRGKSGRDATKLDWVATWRRWMRKAQVDAERVQARASPKASTTDQRVAQAQSMKAIYAQHPQLPGAAS